MVNIARPLVKIKIARKRASAKKKLYKITFENEKRKSRKSGPVQGSS